MSTKNRLASDGEGDRANQIKDKSLNYQGFPTIYTRVIY